MTPGAVTVAIVVARHHHHGALGGPRRPQRGHGAGERCAPFDLAGPGVEPFDHGAAAPPEDLAREREDLAAIHRHRGVAMASGAAPHDLAGEQVHGQELCLAAGHEHELAGTAQTKRTSRGAFGSAPYRSSPSGSRCCRDRRRRGVGCPRPPGACAGARARSPPLPTRRRRRRARAERRRAPHHRSDRGRRAGHRRPGAPSRPAS